MNLLPLHENKYLEAFEDRAKGDEGVCAKVALGHVEQDHRTCQQSRNVCLFTLPHTHAR